MDKYGRSEQISIKNVINGIIDTLSSLFVEEKESKDLNIFIGENDPSNIESSRGVYVAPEDEMSSIYRRGGNYRLIDETKTGVLINYNLIPDIRFTRIEIVPRLTHLDRAKYLYIILEKNGEEIFRSEPGQLVMNFWKIQADKFKLCFDDEDEGDQHVNFTYIKFLYIIGKSSVEIDNYLDALKKNL